MCRLSFTLGFLQHPLGYDPVKLRLAETTTTDTLQQLLLDRMNKRTFIKKDLPHLGARHPIYIIFTTTVLCY